MSMHRFVNAGPIMAGLAAMSEPNLAVPPGASEVSVVTTAERVAASMIRMGFATGHGDTVEDLLGELEWQVAELRGIIEELKPAAEDDGWVPMPTLQPAPMQPIAYTGDEGDEWMPWVEGEGGTFHAILLDDGSIFDQKNGWRPRVLSALVVAQIKADLAARAVSPSRRLEALHAQQSATIAQMYGNGTIGFQQFGRFQPNKPKGL